jgi:hypothetical protein
VQNSGMKKIRKDDLFNSVGAFLKSKGVELTDGTYANTIRSCCGMLTDAVNLSQQGIEKARTEIDSKLERVRRVIHERTAPKPPPVPKTKKPGAKAATAKPTPKPAKPAARARKSPPSAK